MLPALLIIGGLFIVVLLLAIWALWTINPSRINPDELDQWMREQVHKIPGDQ